VTFQRNWLRAHTTFSRTQGTIKLASRELINKKYIFTYIPLAFFTMREH
jgi:hypothetical protein